MKRQTKVILVTITVLIAGIVGCMAIELYTLSTTYQVEEMIESAGGTVIVDSTLLAAAATEVDYEAIAREVLESQVEHQDLLLYGGIWGPIAYDGRESMPDHISFYYYFKYYRFGIHAHSTVFPSENRVSWLFFRGNKPDELDLSSRQVHIPQALQIVNTNGGRTFCETEENGCEVWVHFGELDDRLEASDGDWAIRYEGHRSTLCALVDSQTGEHNIYIRPHTEGVSNCLP
jgi:hypothetical protein